jgi:Tfp pilus assembly protein PilO
MKKQNSLLSGGWTVIVPLTAAIVTYLVFVFFPQMREIRALREDIAQKQSYLGGIAQRTAREAAVDAEEATTREYVTRLRGTAAAPSDVAALFAAVAERLKTAGVTTTIFRPEAKQSFVAVDRIPLSIGCTGEHDRLQSMLAGIERMNQRVWIDEFVLERGKENEEGMTCEVKLAIFVNNFEISD